MCLLPTEDVNDYPAEPFLEPVAWPVVVAHGGRRIAGSVRAWRLLERGRLPVLFVPAEDVDRSAVLPSNQVGIGDEMGLMVFHDVVAGGTLVRNAAWTIDAPPPELAEIAGHYAFSPQRLDVCSVAGQPVDRSVPAEDGDWPTPNVRQAPVPA